MQRMDNAQATAYRSPAKVVIETFGGRRGVSRIARELQLQRCTVWRWTQPKDRYGTGGQIPYRYQRRLLLLAKEMGLPLSAEDLVLGRG